ncbi:MAG: UPF0182 family protein [Pseudonocardia sp.]
MTNRPVSAAGVSRRRRLMLIVGGVFLTIWFTGSWLVDRYVDWLWFDAAGYLGVYQTVLGTRIVLLLAVGTVVGGVLALNLVLAYRNRPIVIPADGAQDPLAVYRTAVLSRPRLLGIGLPVAVGLLAGLVATTEWQTVQLFLNSTGFGVTDPVFGYDVAFYVFTLPFYRWLLGWAFVAVTVSLIASLAAHYLFGGVRAESSVRMSSPAKIHLAVLGGVFVLLVGLDYFFERYELLSSGRSALFTGATYTDLRAVLPAKVILAAIAVLCAVAFFVAAYTRDLRLPAIATALLVLSGLLVGVAWPALLQQFSVAPNANQREALSIERNIEATRAAYGITGEQVDYVDYSAGGATDAAQLADETATTSNIRLLDPALLEPTFTQLQQRENFYGFPDKLDIDRYQTGGDGDGSATQDYVVAVRELETASLAVNQRDWINQHLRFTHGDGFVAARADQVNATAGAAGDPAGASGYPVFTVSDTTGNGAIPVSQPRIYYGELIDSYVIVGGEPGDAPLEYELDGSLYTYTGAGGVGIGSLFKRLVFAAEYAERNILFNEAIGSESKIIFRQDPRERVEAVAPWLTPDGDPYPAVVDGRVTWIVDSYTTLANYPYAQRTVLGAATEDTLPGTPRLPDQTISYIRNSVKATVDAYDGTVTLYATDPADPVLQTWMKAFPGVVKPATDISPQLSAHFRYPQDLFKVQREMLARYHVDDPQVFFSTNDFWQVPSDPTTPEPVNQPPHYVLAGPPAGDGPASFQLTSPMVGLRREFLSAYISVSAEPATYGEMRVLRFPTDAQTLGPQQVQTRFRSSAEVSQELNLLQAAETNVLFGNLLTLPTGEGTLLYVEPVYVQRRGENVSFPQLNRVLVLYGDRVGYAPSLEQALTEAVGAAVPAPATGGQPPGPTATPGQGATVAPQAAQAASDVRAALQRLREAFAAGDFTAAGAALTALEEATRRFEAQTAPAAAPTPPAGPTAPAPDGGN